MSNNVSTYTYKGANKLQMNRQAYKANDHESISKQPGKENYYKLQNHWQKM